MDVAKHSSYEQFRLKRIEENKKRMEALNLPQLSLSLSPVKTSPTKKNTLRLKEKQLVVVRRSSRLANVDTPVFKQFMVHSAGIPRRIFKGRNLSDRVYASSEARAKALEKAEKLEAGLESGFQSFIKSMLPSHVSGCFCLGLPAQFCKSYLGSRDGVMTLIDENGEEYQTVYLDRKTGLSGGWKGFAVAHGLAVGDAIVFQLIRPTAFKVYIIRAAGFEESTES